MLNTKNLVNLIVTRKIDGTGLTRKRYVTQPDNDWQYE